MSKHDERREEPRYPVNGDTRCPYVLPVADDLGNSVIENLSMTGIGIRVEQSVSPGTILTVGLANKVRDVLKTVLVEVVHSTPQLGGGYVVGGKFLTPLTYEELSVFVL